MTRDESTTVKVDVRMEDGVVVLSPCDTDGKELLQQVLDGGAETSLWNYQGVRHSDPYTEDRIIGVNYACGGTSYDRTEGNSTWTDYEGAIKIHFDLQAVNEVDALAAMRNIGYYAGGMIVQPDSTSEQMRLRPKKDCKVCGGVLRKRIELEWLTCDACSAVCEHDYEWGMGQAGGRIAHMRFCITCGRADPDWKPSENPMEDLVKVVTEGDIHALIIQHPDKSTTLITKQ